MLHLDCNRKENKCVGRRSERTFWDSATMNNDTYITYYNRLVGIALSMFEWHNLPDTIDERFLEMALFGDGKALFFKDEVTGYLALQFFGTEPLNVYRIPLNREAYSANGYHVRRDETNSVIIWNNVTHTNSFLDVDTASRRLYDIQRTIDTNIKAQKTPIMITAKSETEKMTMKNAYMQYDGNAPFIFTYKDFDPNNIKAVQTQAPYVADVLFNAKKEIWNEALSALGVPVTDRVKRERLLAAEIAGDKASSVAQQFVRLNPRKKACEEINKMFGLNVEVTYRRLDDMALLDYELAVEGVSENMATVSGNDIVASKGVKKDE